MLRRKLDTVSESLNPNFVCIPFPFRIYLGLIKLGWGLETFSSLRLHGNRIGAAFLSETGLECSIRMPSTKVGHRYRIIGSEFCPYSVPITNPFGIH